MTPPMFLMTSSLAGLVASVELRATPAYTLFNGPHTSGSDCALVYDRFYSPIGVCRFLDIKPGT